jgi:hypothetical protein
MSIHIDEAKYFFGNISVLEDIICEKPALIFVRHLFHEDVTELSEVAMHRRISPHHPNDTRKTL